MFENNRFPPLKTAIALLTVLFLAGNAMAYVGPVPGPEFIGYFGSLIAWMVLIFSSILLWPIHALLRRFRGTKPGVDVQPTAAPVEEPAAVSSDPT